MENEGIKKEKWHKTLFFCHVLSWGNFFLSLLVVFLSLRKKLLKESRCWWVTFKLLWFETHFFICIWSCGLEGNWLKSLTESLHVALSCVVNTKEVGLESLYQYSQLLYSTLFNELHACFAFTPVVQHRMTQSQSLFSSGYFSKSQARHEQWRS